MKTRKIFTIFTLVAVLQGVASLNAEDITLDAALGIVGGYPALFPSEYLSFGITMLDVVSVGVFVKVTPLMLVAWDYGASLRMQFGRLLVENRVTTVFWKETHFTNYSIGAGWSLPIATPIAGFPNTKESLNFIAGVTVWDISHSGTYSHPFWDGYNYLPIFIDVSWKISGGLGP